MNLHCYLSLNSIKQYSKVINYHYFNINFLSSANKNIFSKFYGKEEMTASPSVCEMSK